MPRYFFPLTGGIPAHDLIGYPWENDDEAKAHAEFLAHRIGTEKLEMVREAISFS
jgi:hypothetical protein